MAGPRPRPRLRVRAARWYYHRFEAVNGEAERLLSDGGPAYQPVTWTPARDSTNS
jgi:hypothetical protein